METANSDWMTLFTALRLPFASQARLLCLVWPRIFTGRCREAAKNQRFHPVGKTMHWIEK